ncbi:hypothetical protein B0H63DRAFT_556796 [Podospora didyma]|uniref:Neprosin PEP catalytic domain-containing protein n=1 Tax=Podospora didyma TaxID=330526 RepID=A0AAE0U3P4_9PEZI|nr:hypothetical protein B0H63DRAFT_556796 [Podospora didyma]
MKLSLSLAAYSVLALGVNAAPTADNGNIGFSQFLGDVRNKANPGPLSKVISASSSNGFQIKAVSKEVVNHITKMYGGIKDASKVSSFVLNGTYVDCIPVNEQPTVHSLNISRIASPPAFVYAPTYPYYANGSTSGGNYTGGPVPPGVVMHGAPSVLSLGLKDAFNKSISCPAGTIPMQRLAVDTLARFSSLKDFLAKQQTGGSGSSGSAASPRSNNPLSKRAENPHKYAVVADYVTNFGGNSWLSIWKPKAWFSISQQWYTVRNPQQTVEGGWTVNHSKWDAQPRLFIFYTPDGYKSGCWNLECPGFVQTTNTWLLGGPFLHYSVPGGAQWGFQMQWKLYRGNWWLFLQGANRYLEPVGYYPAIVYGNGPITKNATLAEYGGETAANSTKIYGEMGSAQFPAETDRLEYHNTVAYQSNVYTAPREESSQGEWAKLGGQIVSKAACYGLMVNSARHYFYFGGTGGTTTTC